MTRKRFLKLIVAVILVVTMIFPAAPSFAATTTDPTQINTITNADRQAAADMMVQMGATMLATDQLVTDPNTGYKIPDYYGSGNWAYTKPIRKFVDGLPGLGPASQNALGQYIPLAEADTTTYLGADYYEIAVVEYYEKLHSDLEPTLLRGYVQISTDKVPGNKVPLFRKDGTTPIMLPNGTQAYAVDKPHYLGPAIIAASNKPARIKFYNLLPTGTDGDLFIPVDTTVMGAGAGPSMDHGGMTMTDNYTQNRATIHLHGNNTVWISDGTPHQWITPAGENTMYPQGVSVVDVPDMDNVSDPKDGTTTFYYTNAQNARLMFYHDHSYGITRLNVYAGEAAAYLITDDVEKDLINGTNVTGINPGLQKILPDMGIPLIIQDKTFVDSATVLDTDPTWAWGSEKGKIKDGDLWYPHVYSPAQNPDDPAGANPYGRWMYGPFFWPPTSQIAHGPIPNPYYDPVNAPWEPTLIPSIPNPSAPGESFMDTPLVNGTAYPFINVEPKTYRFRVLNAANDRFFNLQMYVADPNGYSVDGYGTEVKMIPSTGTPGLPADYPSGIPDPAMKGPDWVQIGTEGGFLPAPVVIPSQPITWNLNATNFNFGNVAQHSLLVGTAERADVLVDFSQYAGKTIILYNDAPAAFPAGDSRYDFYTGNPDQTDTGGAPSTQPGYGPNTRTIMQIRVAATTPEASYDLAGLESVFAKSADKRGVFEVSHKPIVIPQAAYNSAYNVSNLPADPAKAYLQQFEFTKTFQPINKDGVLQAPVTLRVEPKAMQDEMGEVYDEYGRMSGMLGLTNPNATSAKAAFIPYGYASPPVDIVKGIKDLDATAIGSLEDGTQLWMITHNGVDTHTIHTHLFDAQLVNRVAWDGAMMPPDANELGYKETFRVNPLEHTILALRPKVPNASQLPFQVPNSVRLIDPSMPEGAPLMAPPPAGWFDTDGNQIAGDILNHYVNYGWEYVYHCHILSHEEMDMMHSVSAAVAPAAPAQLTVTRTGNGNNRNDNLTWVDSSMNETGILVQRSATANGPWTTLASLPANTTTYSYRIGNTNNTYYYRVYASNTVGDAQTPGFPTVTVDSGFSNVVSVGTVQIQSPAAPTNLTALLQQGPQVQLNWTDNANNETGFVIERSANGGAFSTLVTVGARNNTGSVSFNDTTVAPNTSYQYRVAAVNDAGYSTYSNTAAVTLPALPAAPTQVTATAVSSGNNARVTIAWRDNANNETGYIIQRATNSTFTANLVTTTVGANTTTYQTGNLNRNTQYYFRVMATNAAGNSTATNAAPFPILTP